MSFVKYLKESKTFIIYSVIAAIVGVILTFFVGGCGNDGDNANVLVSKRVRVELKDLPAGQGEGAARTDTDKVVEETIKPGAAKGASVPEKTARAEKPAAHAPKPAGKVVTAPRQAQKKRAVAAKKGHTKPSPQLKTWAVNVVSFLSPSDAERLRKRLISSGYNTYVTKFRKGTLLFYRVRVGFFKSRDAAQKAGLSIAGKYRDVGKPWVVKPGWREVAEHIK